MTKAEGRVVSGLYRARWPFRYEVQQTHTTMKITQTRRCTLVAAVLAFALPVRGDTMSVPSKEAPAYTFDVPSSWNPKADTEDESVEATAPGDHAYLSAWIAKATDSAAIAKDMEATLKDALKSIDESSSEQPIEVN